jgi:hypothetical protein
MYVSQRKETIKKYDLIFIIWYDLTPLFFLTGEERLQAPLRASVTSDPKYFYLAGKVPHLKELKVSGEI